MRSALRKRPGRPRRPDADQLVQVGYRLPADLVERLRAWADTAGLGYSDAAAALLRRALDDCEAGTR